MDLSLIVMWLGFALASYSVVGNDVIQTLGTFLTSNENERPWWVMFLFAGSILAAVLIYGYVTTDIAYGRLDKFDFPVVYHWYYLLPPIVLMTITRWGIPVSTTFMILTLFSLHNVPGDFATMSASVFDTSTVLGGMIKKSIFGYFVSFAAAAVLYMAITSTIETYFIKSDISKNERSVWTVLQWLATGFLWSQWLTQDLANIYIYLRGGEGLSVTGFVGTLAILLALLGYIFYSRGGKIQNVVRSKTNTSDIRSATIIDFSYGLILLLFKYDYLGLWGGKIPMSTTWIFVGLLAGREIGIRLMLEKKLSRGILGNVLGDLAKIFAGLVISVLLVFLIKQMGG